MVDGLDSPENMNRCLFNSINFEGFWRMWHRGFNQWLIRYIFLPLGGSRFKLFNIWIVFTFVAIWHDF
jgi:D-alanyl-lipoteichoic acid acyltransferase DltB (MBOAT superfamily)